MISPTPACRDVERDVAERPRLAPKPVHVRDAQVRDAELRRRAASSARYVGAAPSRPATVTATGPGSPGTGLRPIRAPVSCSLRLPPPEEQWSTIGSGSR